VFSGALFVLLLVRRFLLGAEDYGRGKPHPEPYQTAIDRLGVDASRCVVLEDALGIVNAIDDVYIDPYTRS